MSAIVRVCNPAMHRPSWQIVLVLLALSGVLFGGAGCASRQRHPNEWEDSTNIERPAEPLSEEETLADKIGQVGVVLLVVAVTVGGIVMLIFLL